METTSSFLDRLGGDLCAAYARHSARRRRRRIVLLVIVSALVLAAAATAVTGIVTGFGIDQGKHADIVGTPPRHIACGPSGCVRVRGRAAPSGRWLYYFSHSLGYDLPSTRWGSLSESAPAQDVFDANGKTLSRPDGAELSYACTTIEGDRLDCIVLSRFGGTLPHGTAIYVLSASEYPGYMGPFD
jgi:hypothetical protein